MANLLQQLMQLEMRNKGGMGGRSASPDISQTRGGYSGIPMEGTYRRSPRPVAPDMVNPGIPIEGTYRRSPRYGEPGPEFGSSPPPISPPMYPGPEVYSQDYAGPQGDTMSQPSTPMYDLSLMQGSLGNDSPMGAYTTPMGPYTIEGDYAMPGYQGTNQTIQKSDSGNTVYGGLGSLGNDSPMGPYTPVSSTPRLQEYAGPLGAVSQPSQPRKSYTQNENGNTVEIGYDGQPISGYTPEQMAVHNAVMGITPSQSQYVFNGEGYDKMPLQAPTTPDIGGVRLGNGQFIAGVSNYPVPQMPEIAYPAPIEPPRPNESYMKLMDDMMKNRQNP